MRIPRLNLLYTIAHCKPGTRDWEDMLSITNVANLLIDSGGYTNFVSELKGKVPPISFKSYSKAMQQVHGRVWAYVSLDDPARPAVTAMQLDQLYQDGLTPMPVFSPGMSFDIVPKLLTYLDGRVCVGGCVGARPQYAHHRYQQIAKVTGGNAKVHALGYTRLPEMFQLPIATVDSHSFGHGRLSGYFMVYDKARGRMSKAKKLAPYVLRHASRCNVTTKILQDPAAYTGRTGLASLMGVNAYMNLHVHAAERGQAYFFAGSESWIKEIASVLHAKNGELFDYQEARSYCEGLRILMKKDRPAFQRRLAETFERYTFPLLPNQPIAKEATP
jgi:hypothetical protein